jgi:hypothetical protein
MIQWHKLRELWDFCAHAFLCLSKINSHTGPLQEVVRERTQNYHYMAQRVYWLMDAEEGSIGMEVLLCMCDSGAYLCMCKKYGINDEYK